MTFQEFCGEINYLTAAIGKPLAQDPIKELPARLEAFYELLGDLPIEVFRLAVRRVALSHRWATFPNSAELRQAAADVIQGNAPGITAAEAWQLAYSAACKLNPELNGPYCARGKDGQMKLFGSQFEWLTDGMPAIVVEAWRCFGVSVLCNADPNFAQTQFTKIFDSLVQRDNVRALIPEQLRREIESVGAGRALRHREVLRLASAIGASGEE